MPRTRTGDLDRGAPEEKCLRMRRLGIGCLLALGGTLLAQTPQDREEPPAYEVLPALNARVNAAFEGRRIPWCQDGAPCDALVTASWVSEEPLVRTVQGSWSRTLYRFEYAVDKVVEGQLPERTLTFFAELRFPTPESGIKLKLLWPFQKGKPLRFRLRRGTPRLVIVSVEP